MRIAIDARYLNDSYSGVGRYSENLITHLAQIDQANEYVVFIHPSYNRRLKVGENFTIVPYPLRPLSLKSLFLFGRQVRKRRCDFLHCLFPVAPLFGVRKKLLTVHDLFPYTNREDIAPWNHNLPDRFKNAWMRIVFPHFVRTSTWFISVSHCTKFRLAQMFPALAHKAIVIHSGVEKFFFDQPDPTIVQLAQNKLRLPEQYILYVGNVQPRKNLPRMLRTFAQCVAKHQTSLANLQFILLLGSDEKNPQVSHWLRSLGVEKRVRVIGEVTNEEKRVLYHKAQLLFSVTRGEGFGFPIVEAQAAGLPVLAGDDASVPEITGNSALLVGPEDEAAMVETLAQMLLSPELGRRLSESGRENAARYSWETVARDMLQVYEILL